MYEIDADRQANRLYIDLNGRMDADAIADAADESVAEAADLRKGFDIVNDLAGFKPPSPEAAQPIKRAQGELQEMGVDRVVRVTDEETSDVVIHAFERRSQDVGYSGEVAESVEEAETLLETEGVEGFAD